MIKFLKNFSIGLALSLLLTGCAESSSAPIVIKTRLTDGETVSHVELTDGELYFKTEEELLSQLSPEDYLDNRPAASDYHAGETGISYKQLNGGKEYTQSDEF